MKEIIFATTLISALSISLFRVVNDALDSIIDKVPVK